MPTFQSAFGNKFRMIASYSVPFVEKLFDQRETIYLHDYKIAIGKEVWNTHFSRRHLIKGSKRCAMCGIEGNMFILEHHKVYAFSLYHKTADDKFILMTCDHIIPISHGGNQRVCNLQTLCTHCNNKKSNFIVKEFVTPKLINYFFPFGLSHKK
jgi:5-methylcytosine-specific restriction endonuclease McrA